MRKTFVFAAILALLVPGVAQAKPLVWQGWSSDLFERSKRDNKLVLLDLEAVWCHWCHVMEVTTYSDPQVQALLNEHFITVKVDQDANPDLSNRYGDWGWPATILYAPDGTEIAKLRGYRDPEMMASILKAFIAEPTPGPSAVTEVPMVASTAMFFSVIQRALLEQRWKESYDAVNGGWGSIQKFMHPGSMDLALSAAEAGDANAARQARQTLDQALKLIDRVDGGMFQYSDKADWRSPHYEKIMTTQAYALRTYAYASRLFDDPAYATAADDIARYLMIRLQSPDGGFYVSQDADVSADFPGKDYYALDAAGRAKHLAPAIDTHLYTRESAMATAALASSSAFTGNRAALDAALRGARWTMANRALPGGGFKHGGNDRAGPYLADTMAMGQAAIDLYAATGDRAWLMVAGGAGDFIAANFRGDAGYVTSAIGETSGGPLSKPAFVVEENIDAARFFNALNRYLGRDTDRQRAGHAMQALASDAVLNSPRFLDGALVADQELAVEPVHLTLVGHHGDRAAEDLHAAAAAYPAFYRRLDWWDMREGPLPNPDVQYPDMGEAALFACSNQICSQPIFKADQIDKVVKAMTALRVTARE